MPDNKVITLCPKCLRPIREVKSTVSCPQVSNAAVCMSHCFNSCEHLEQSISLQRCRYKDNKKKAKEGVGHKKISLH